jgi:hypothetical protein
MMLGRIAHLMDCLGLTSPILVAVRILFCWSWRSSLDVHARIFFRTSRSPKFLFLYHSFGLAKSILILTMLEGLSDLRETLFCLETIHSLEQALDCVFLHRSFDKLSRLLDHLGERKCFSRNLSPNLCQTFNS